LIQTLKLELTFQKCFSVQTLLSLESTDGNSLGVLELPHYLKSSRSALIESKYQQIVVTFIE
jgi:hypothetical protein